MKAALIGLARRPADRVGYRRTVLRVGDQLVQFFVRAIRLDVKADPDFQEFRWDRHVQTKSTADIDVAFDFGREFTMGDPARRRVQDECRGDAADECMRQDSPGFAPASLPRRTGGSSWTYSNARLLEVSSRPAP